jgi:hypothetical protein
VHGKEKLSKEPVKNEPTFFYKQERHWLRVDCWFLYCVPGLHFFVFVLFCVCFSLHPIIIRRTGIQSKHWILIIIAAGLSSQASSVFFFLLNNH